MPFPIVLAAFGILAAFFFFVLVQYRALNRKNKALEKSLRSAQGERNQPSLTDKIKLSKHQLETAFDAITDFICAIDRDYKIVRVNKSYAQYVNLPIRDILGKQCFEVFWKQSSPCDTCPAGRTFLQGTPVAKQQFMQRDLYNVRYFDVGTYPVPGTDGATENVIEYIRDVTEEKNIMEQLIRSEKLATIGTMTAGIAHEMINPLSGISGTVANMLQVPEKYGLNQKGVQRVSTLMDATARATMIMKDLLHLSRKEEGTSVLTEINTIIKKAVNAVQLKGLSSAEYKLLLEKTLPKVLCDPVKIEQVIINMVTNAVQSITEKKERLAFEGKEHNGMIIISTQPVDETVHIDIIDNGMGISEDIKGKIFDPFFTTRAPGEGTGLGLSVCHRIIEEHNGRIVVESNNGLTTFTIIMPVHTPQ
ncbi:MAG: ATP-binding protein [Chitinivibrionales bacterium]